MEAIRIAGSPNNTEAAEKTCGQKIRVRARQDAWPIRAVRPSPIHRISAEDLLSGSAAHRPSSRQQKRDKRARRTLADGLSVVVIVARCFRNSGHTMDVIAPSFEALRDQPRSPPLSRMPPFWARGRARAHAAADLVNYVNTCICICTWRTLSPCPTAASPASVGRSGGSTADRRLPLTSQSKMLALAEQMMRAKILSPQVSC